MELRYLDQARSELDDIIGWYERQQSGLGQRFKVECDTAEEQVISWPNAWPSIGPGLHRYLLKTFSYELIYLLNSEMISVIAIAHTSRRPGYWRSRLKH